MRTDLLLAGGLAALVVGATVAIGRAAAARSEDVSNAVAITSVVLLEMPRDGVRPSGFVAPGTEVFVEPTGAFGWLYVIGKTGAGYAREENFAFTGREENVKS